MIEGFISEYDISKFLERFKFVKLLGSGSYGEVELYTDTQSCDAKRAVKRIRKTNLTPENEAKLKSEASLMKELDHPNLVKLFDVYDGPAEMLLVLEYCDGGDLFSLIEAHRIFPEKQVATFTKQILLAVNYLNTKGIAHRDLKPENFLLTSNGVLKVADFGLSYKYTINPQELMFSRVGSPFYVCRDVLLADKPPSNTPLENCSIAAERVLATGDRTQRIYGGYDHKIDIWSIGVITYLLASGTVPFMGRDDRETLKKVIQCRIDLSALTHTSYDCRHFILSCLEKLAQRRLSPAQALDHPFIASAPASLIESPSTEPKSNTPPVDAPMVRSIRRFARAPMLKKRALVALAYSSLSNDDFDQLRTAFAQLDSDNDGVVTLQDIKSGAHALLAHDKQKSQALSVALQHIENALMLGSDRDNAVPGVEWSTFVGAVLEKRAYLREEALQTAFKMLAKGKNYIEGKEVTQLLEDDRIKNVFFANDEAGYQRHTELIKACAMQMEIDDDDQETDDDQSPVMTPVLDDDTASSNGVYDRRRIRLRLNYEEFCSVMRSKAFDPSQCFTQSQENWVGAGDEPMMVTGEGDNGNNSSSNGILSIVMSQTEERRRMDKLAADAVDHVFFSQEKTSSSSGVFVDEEDIIELSRQIEKERRRAMAEMIGGNAVLAQHTLDEEAIDLFKKGAESSTLPVDDLSSPMRDRCLVGGEGGDSMVDNLLKLREKGESTPLLTSNKGDERAMVDRAAEAAENQQPGVMMSSRKRRSLMDDNDEKESGEETVLSPTKRGVS